LRIEAVFRGPAGIRPRAENQRL